MSPMYKSLRIQNAGMHFTSLQILSASAKSFSLARAPESQAIAAAVIFCEVDTSRTAPHRSGWTIWVNW